MKVKLSFGQISVILLLSRLNIESKGFFTKVVQFGMPFENVTKKVKVKLSFGQIAVISSLSKLNIESKSFFYKNCSVGMLFENVS